MIQRGLAVQSDFLQFFVVFPTKLLLFLISLALVFPPALTEKLFIFISFFSFIALVLSNLSGRFYLRSLFIGGDLFLGLFLLIAVWGGSQASSLWPTLSSLKWIFFLYFLTYSFDLFPAVNSRVFSLVSASTLMAAFAIAQTQVDFGSISGFSPLLSTPSPFHDIFPYSAAGLLHRPEIFGYLMALLLCFPLSAAIVHHRLSRRFRFLMIFAAIMISTAVILTFQPSAALLIGVGLLSVFFVTRRTGWLILTGALLLSSPYLLSKLENGELREKLNSHKIQPENDQRLILRANLKMFQDKPWFGVGYNQNKDGIEKYLESSLTAPPTYAPNTYFQLLSTTGLFGFLAFMSFSLMFLFSTLRLWQEIPKTHLWHRSFAVASMACQVVFHGTGLFSWTLNEAALVYPFIFALAISSLLTRRYAQGIVPDDYSV